MIGIISGWNASEHLVRIIMGAGQLYQYLIDVEENAICDGVGNVRGSRWKHDRADFGTKQKVETELPAERPHASYLSNGMLPSSLSIIL